ncbi:phage head closure protein [Vibrio sp. SCSIO 43136]|uniref:phage head closure protein n=1 Tax=Vibrio sp. SCSIO 43136 TaxID=2819101 RepID=UPI00207589E0|nr:phage head closure protein [Vibrio sp. SCSIO 43136]USD68133.1 phage head closure protein [Vibrio sp. SCSIO 43136]
MRKAGKRNQRIVLYQTTQTKSPNGALSDSIKEIASVWAEKLSANSQGTNLSVKVAVDTNFNREQPTQTIQWRIRYREDLSSGDWIQWRGKWLRVVAVDDTDIKRAELLFDACLTTDKPPPEVT